MSSVSECISLTGKVFWVQNIHNHTYITRQSQNVFSPRSMEGKLIRLECIPFRCRVTYCYSSVIWVIIKLVNKLTMEKKATRNGYHLLLFICYLGKNQAGQQANYGERSHKKRMSLRLASLLGTWFRCLWNATSFWNMAAGHS